ncbi:MAG: exodeoxyribonuclease V subunit gamma [Fibrobacter sp.]|nr:exodeoxyribonuclease V subunit gamma [Fibrobacter sp.]
MLHLKFALNLENLADEMIDEVSRCWKKPFEAPVVIFPDPKLEQWFRLRWVQKKGVLANLNKSTIDRFLFDILVGDNPQLKKLSSDMLANVIISYLQQKTDGKFNYELLGDSVKAYLESDGAIDENRLFDFANVMAGLFLEYETSRPSGFITDSETLKNAEGILDCWKQDKLRDFFITRNGTPDVNEAWQRKLYSALFHIDASKKSLLTRVFEKSSEKNSEGGKVTYLTLPYLYEACKGANRKTEFHYQGDLPVFIFGLSGMGQFYRVILQEFANQHEVYAYIQNPCMAFWEDCNGTRRPIESMRPVLPKLTASPDEESETIDADENELLRYWGKAGRDNIKLWSIATDYNFVFNGDSIIDSNREMPCDSLLHNVQWMIAHRKNVFCDGTDILGKLPFKNDTSFSVTTAPSKIREVEALHSRICRLLSEKDPQGNPKATIADILVVSPNIEDYRTAIFQVFDQTREGFHVPFSIVDSRARDSHTANALSILFSIRDKGTLSRPDFFALVRNPVVQKVRGIPTDEISNWESWASNMNVYRDRIVSDNGTTRREESWITATRRLLLSRFSYGSVGTNTGEIQPYSDINSNDSSSLYRFIDAIDSLESWMGVDTDLTAVFQFLDSWLCMGNPPKELSGESIIYHSVTEARKNLEYQLLAGSETLSWKILSQTLLYAARGTEYSCGNLFINGLTFMKFAPNRIIPTKYLFFIGADAANFPGVRNTNTLDLRKSCRPWPGDDSIVSRNRYAFLCQLMSTAEGFFISYVNMDLQKDEDFYPSSIVNDIRGFLRNAVKAACTDGYAAPKDIWPDFPVPLDETRPWKDLFTRREIRNKKTLLEFGNDSAIVNFAPNETNNSDTRLPEQVSIYQFKEFLKDPFEFRVAQMMQIEDEREDPEKTEFEPILTDRLQETILRRMLLSQMLGVFESKRMTTEESIRTYALSKGLLPKGSFCERIWKGIREEAGILADAINLQFGGTGFRYARRTIDLKMEGWALTGNIPLYAQDKNSIHLIDTAGVKIHQYHFLSGYIQALALICEAARKNESVPQIYVEVYSQKEWKAKRIKLTPAKAEKLLNEIYRKMFSMQADETGKPNRYSKVLPIDMVFENNIESYDDYIQAFADKNNSPWKYFAGSNLFDIEKVCGFNENDFMAVWNKECADLKGLTPSLWEPDNDIGGAVNG